MREEQYIERWEEERSRSWKLLLRRQDEKRKR